MLYEARPEVRAKFLEFWQAAKNKLRSRPTMKHWLTQYGIIGDTVWASRQYEEDYDGLHYAWVRNGPGKAPGTLITVWSERVSIDDKGTWFFEDNLNLDQTDDGHLRDELQRARTQERIDILRAAHEHHTPVDAILLENSRTRIELQTPPHPSSKIKESVRDMLQWHVVDWKENPPRALVIRGPHYPGWRKPDDESGEPTGLCFPNQAHRDAVEAAAVKAVTSKYSADFNVRSREKDCLGYDLELTSRRTGEVELLLEVKGTAMTTPHFFITRNEMRCGQEDPRWHLVIVTEALLDPQVGKLQTWGEVDASFERTAIVWHAELREK